MLRAHHVHLHLHVVRDVRLEMIHRATAGNRHMHHRIHARHRLAHRRKVQQIELGDPVRCMQIGPRQVEVFAQEWKRARTDMSPRPRQQYTLSSRHDGASVRRIAAQCTLVRHKCNPLLRGYDWIMPAPAPSSRRRFADYLQRHRERLKLGQSAVSDATLRPRGTQRTRSAWTLLCAFFRLLGSNRTPLIISVALSAVATLLGLIPLYAPKIVLDYVLTDQPVPDAWQSVVTLPNDPQALLTLVVVAIITFAVIALAVGICSRLLTTRTNLRMQVNMRRMVFEHAVRLPLHRVYELKSGGVASILREDAGGVGQLVFSMVHNPWKAIVQLLGSLTILTLTDWRLLVGSLVILPIVFISHRTWISRIRPLWRDIRAARQHIDAGATEAFGGMRVVRSFGRQKTEAAHFTQNNHIMIRQEMLAWWWARAIDIAWSILIPGASAALLWYGGNRILHDMVLVEAGVIDFEDALTPGDLIAFLFYVGALLGPLATLAVSATSFQNNLAALDRILDLLAEPKEMPPKPGAIRLAADRVHARIRFHDVAFAYTGSEKPVLADINLDVQPGQMIAMVGTSGSGKTTLCNLVARFYDPTEGRITLDNTDLRDIEVDSYRRLLGIVEQDIFLFDGTVAQNIAYGKRHAAQQEIERAAELANAAQFVRDLQDGYETVIGERGVKLSGGQRQRVAIARAILADPTILILDEATSNLDTESERLIQQSLETLMAGRTSFVIAHRLSTIAHADLILVLENGRIIERGSHGDLMARFGRYQEMVALQTAPAPGSPTPGSSPAPGSDSTSDDDAYDSEPARVGPDTSE